MAEWGWTRWPSGSLLTVGFYDSLIVCPIVGGQTEEEEEEEEAPANPIAAMTPEEWLATKKKRVRPSAATRTVAAVDQLKVCSAEHMTALVEQGQRTSEERERGRQSHREIMERALELHQRAVQNQERSLDRSDQEQRRLNTTLEVQTALMGQMVEILRGGQGGTRCRRVHREQSGRGRAVPRVVEEGSGQQEPPARAILPAEEQGVVMEVELSQQPLAGPSSSLFSDAVAAPAPTTRPQRQRATGGGLGSRGREH
ncbi:uncharacterized protein LOC121919589 isoform X1 [Sceloporus undulatus]|uniref:uncharacterized protein LOC121919589 isoform X1 n=1 Tax=Sceloporus undulatus TaxID=8520 RepID=UPI001C4B97A7|nr:uncharacterized protein LOC121919589 isoform X1 [Sceloporus undulatus]